MESGDLTHRGNEDLNSSMKTVHKGFRPLRKCDLAEYRMACTLYGIAKPLLSLTGTIHRNAR